MGIVGSLGACFFLREELGALLREHVELAVHPFAGFINQLHSVAQVAVNEAVAVWDPAVAHQDHDLVDGLRILGEIVPEHCAIVGVCEVCGWVTFLRVDEFAGTSPGLARRRPVCYSRPNPNFLHRS